jgi:hypothetical protein
LVQKKQKLVLFQPNICELINKSKLTGNKTTHKNRWATIKSKSKPEYHIPLEQIQNGSLPNIGALNISKSDEKDIFSLNINIFKNNDIHYSVEKIYKS